MANNTAGNGNGTRNGNGPVTRNTIASTAPKYVSAAAHSDAARELSRRAAFHAGEAARLSRGKSGASKPR